MNEDRTFPLASAPGGVSTAGDRPIILCWIQHGGEIEWAKEIADHLRCGAISVRFVSFMRSIADRYANQGWPSDFIGEIFSSEHHLGEEELKELERRYGPPSLECIAASDVHLRMLYRHDVAAKIQIIGRALRFWERYFARHAVTAAIVRDTASLSTRCAYLVARKLGNVPILLLGLGPDDRRFALYDVETQSCWSELVDAVAAGPHPLSPDRVSFIEAYVEKRVDPSRTRAMTLKLGAPSIRRLPFWLYRSWRSERALDIDRSPLDVAVERLSRDIILRRFIWRETRRFFRYDMPCEEPYVYFPLFHTEEAVHLVNIRFWCRHIEKLVSQIAEALPLGHSLYVKEHPAVLGDISRALLRRLRRNPKVRLIAPEVPSQRLSALARAVITLEGTVGWEALLLRRPLVVLSGNPYYSLCPAVFRVEDICKLDRVLAEAVFSGEARYQGHGREEWLWFIDCVIRTTRLGVLYAYEYPHKKPHQVQNLVNVANAISQKIRGGVSAPRAAISVS
jgi:hypothetical protein